MLAAGVSPPTKEEENAKAFDIYAKPGYAKAADEEPVDEEPPGDKPGNPPNRPPLP